MFVNGAILLASMTAPAAGASPYALVAHAAAGGNASGATTAGINTTGADVIYLLTCSYAPGTYPTVGDSTLVLGVPTPTGNTWAKVADQLGGSGNAYRVTLWYCESPVVGTGHTFFASGSVSFATPAVAAFSGGTSPSLDQQSGAGTTGATLSAGSVTPSTANQLVIAGVLFNQAGQSVSIDSGFTILDQLAPVASNSFGIGLAYQIQGAASATNPTWTATAASDGMAAIIATFKSA